MTSFFTPPKTYRPRRVILSDDQNADNAALKAAFDQLGSAPTPGRIGVGSEFSILDAVEPYHAVTKSQLDASPASATAAAASAVAALASEVAAAASALSASTSAVATINRVKVVSADYSVPLGGGSYELFVSAGGATRTIDLPTSPVDGQMVEVSDTDYTASDFPLTVTRGGNTIHGSATDLIIDVDGATVVFIFFSGDWLLKGVPL